ncbi:MAG TPA: NAD-dependent epimerase/dehydratase family protein [Candidatus Paceibacterota bacterium]|nr:NAD-dependent epimerase/dehydratase family protein [Candidatus Paceibacterota bacterium]
MEKVVVTGGAGFIGSNLVDALVAKGSEVHAVDTYVSGKREDRVNAKATYHEVDIRSTEKIQEIFQGADVVYHTAAIPRVPYSVEHPVETTDFNVTGTASVLAAAAQAKVRRVVYSSSGSAYGDQAVLPLVETMTANPVNPYGLQKYVGELFCKIWPDVYGVQTVSLRYFNVYGPKLDPTGPYALAVGAFLLARKEGRPLTIFGDGTITRDYTHVRDVVQANLLAAASSNVGKGEVINIGAGRNVTIKYLAELVGGEIAYGPPRVEAHDSKADNRKAKELLGWEPTVTLEEGIAELKKLMGVA